MAATISLSSHNFIGVRNLTPRKLNPLALTQTQTLTLTKKQQPKTFLTRGLKCRSRKQFIQLQSALTRNSLL